MPWILFLLALVFVVAATLQLLSARIGNATRHVNILSPEELRVLREQAQVERMRTEGSQPAGTDTSPPSASA